MSIPLSILQEKAVYADKLFFRKQRLSKSKSRCFLKKNTFAYKSFIDDK